MLMGADPVKRKGRRLRNDARLLFLVPVAVREHPSLKLRPDRSRQPGRSAFLATCGSQDERTDRSMAAEVTLR
jgi:hypothetical protein